MKLVVLRVVVVGVMFLLAAPAAAQPAGPKERGFAFEAQLGTRFYAADYGDGPSMPLTAVDGGFFAGYKVGRFQVGASIDFTRYSVELNGHTVASSLLTIMPGFRAAILRSGDERVEFFGQVDFGYGHDFRSGPTAGEDHNRVVYQIGPGIRLWFHPNFAVGALVGLRGEFDIQQGEDGATIGWTSVFARLTLTGVF